MRRISPPDSFVRLWPLKRISPSVGSTRRRIERPSVDLPQPDSPTRPSVSPWRMLKSTPSTARTCATVRWSTPAVIGNHVLRPFTSISGSADVHARLSWGFVAVSGTGLTSLARLGLPLGGQGGHGIVFRSHPAGGHGAELGAALGHPAGGALRPPHPLQRRRLLDAALDPERAARMERAAGGQVAQVRRQALDRAQGLVLLGVEPRDRLEQGPRVRVL